MKCDGFCWMKKAGVVVWRCDQTQCPFWNYFFTSKVPMIETCFT